ncbi:MAG: tyrosine-type recombinase/integrase [Chloroflexi bacterium]|nr:tyrosine-type recombinase/integrase [Chloroflexota bacterium]MDA8188584.1 tyrosine-type recombinase/integrase [Dehalococcoidales bacterium]
MRKDIQAFIGELAGRESYSRATLRAYRYELERFVEFAGDCAPDVINEVGARMYIMKLAASNGAAAQRRALVVLGRFFEWLVGERRVKESPFRRLEMPPAGKPKPTYLRTGDIDHLVGAVENVAFPPRQARDLAMISLMLNGGVRLRELVELDRADVDLDANIVVVGQGRARREIPLNRDLRQRLAQHLVKVPDRGDAPLFTNNKGGRLSRDGVYYLVKRYLRAAGLVHEKGKASPRTLRHTFCAQLLARGANLAVVKELAGHAELSSTSVYLDVPLKDKKAAVGLLDGEGWGLTTETRKHRAVPRI